MSRLYIRRQELPGNKHESRYQSSLSIHLPLESMMNIRHSSEMYFSTAKCKFMYIRFYLENKGMHLGRDKRIRLNKQLSMSFLCNAMAKRGQSF